MAEVVIGGLGQNQSALSVEVEYGAPLPPVFPATEVRQNGAFQQDDNATRGNEVELGAPLAPTFPATEIRQNGLQQADPNSNSPVEVELGGSGTPSFPGVATTNPNVEPDPNDKRNVIVETFPGAVIYPSTEVKFITGSVLNFNP